MSNLVTVFGETKQFKWEKWSIQWGNKSKCKKPNPLHKYHL